MVNATAEVLSDLSEHTEDFCSCSFLQKSALFFTLWFWWGWWLWNIILFGQDGSKWFIFVNYSLMCLGYTALFVSGDEGQMLLLFLARLCIVLPISIIWDIVSCSVLLLLYLLLLFSRLLLQFLLLILQSSLSFLQFSFQILQISILSLLSISLYSLLLSYFCGIQLFAHFKRFGNTMLSPLFLLCSKICIFRRPRYRENTLGSQCIEGCERLSICKTCAGLIESSPLLIGTHWSFARPVEHHPHHTRMDLESSAKACHLCNVLLRSVGLGEGSVVPERPLHESTSLLDSSDDNSMQDKQKLMVKVWEKRFISEKPLLRIQLVGSTLNSVPLTVEEFHRGMHKSEIEFVILLTECKALNIMNAIYQTPLTPQLS